MVMLSKLLRSVVGLVLVLALSHAARAATPELIAAARKEGSVTWYTTLIVDQLARPIADAFERKYGIKVQYVRSGERDIYLRLYNEARAGRQQADVFDAIGGAGTLKQEGLIAKWQPDAITRFPADLRDPEGYWTPMSIYVLEPAFNTNLVKAEEAPRNFDDLLHPSWRGHLAWNSEPSSTGAPGFIGAVLNAMGEQKGMDYLKRLSGQGIIGVPGGARHVLDMVIAGEYPVALQMLTHHAFFSANKGAPVNWARLQDVMAFFITLNVMEKSPHPNAGRLLVDFIVSPEGQQLFRDTGYIPVDPEMAPRDPSLKPDGVNFRVTYFTPGRVDKNLPKWVDIYREIFR